MFRVKFKHLFMFSVSIRLEKVAKLSETKLMPKLLYDKLIIRDFLII